MSGALLLLHLSYSYATLNYHFYCCLFFGLLLLVRLELSRRQQFWEGSGTGSPGPGGPQRGGDQCRGDRAGARFARQGPAEQPTSLFDPFWSTVQDGWQRAEGHIDRMFGGVQGPPIVVVGLAFGNTMQPRENFELGTGLS